MTGKFALASKGVALGPEVRPPVGDDAGYAIGRQRASDDTDTGIAIPQTDRVSTMKCNKQYDESSWQLVDDTTAGNATRQ